MSVFFLALSKRISMKQVLFVILLLSLSPSSSAQSPLQEWEGVYEGQMIIGFTDRPNDTLSVNFKLLPIVTDSSWTYVMTFNSKRFGMIVKDYEMHRDGNSLTNFLLDEKDGIIIEMSLMNDCFYDMFEVMDQIYSSTLRKSGNDLQMDLYTAAKKKALISLSEADEEGNTYEVSSYKPTQHQTVVLKRAAEK